MLIDEITRFLRRPGMTIKVAAAFVLTFWPVYVICGIEGLSHLTSSYWLYKGEFCVLALIHIPAMIAMAIGLAIRRKDRAAMMLILIVFVMVQIVILPFCLYMIAAG